MAMNKKEQAAMEAAMEAALEAAALRSTSPVLPDVAPPQGAALSTGYMAIGGASDHGRVEIACSSFVSHGTGRADKTTSQGSRWLYSSKIAALRALRYEMEQNCAKRLRRIDRQIEEAQAEIAGSSK